MAEDTPKAGTYVLTDDRWTRVLRKDDGTAKGYRIFNKGDEVELTDEEAARLVGGRRRSAVSKEEYDENYQHGLRVANSAFPAALPVSAEQRPDATAGAGVSRPKEKAPSATQDDKGANR